eukprot:CAMPEP_0172509634 /NCGR_PEP_ID=MMETSP1066-20121228/221807_1 /TAXON_ID=671091 /ORGANISM="Coscinodiscus wailesii, Strain CCMP2513" /LENGTH=320 /DNA_ID=CAMNT_0013288219 /DNA_START=148 /DNA_END=1110 /DNA_ORIENTATION=-
MPSSPSSSTNFDKKSTKQVISERNPEIGFSQSITCEPILVKQSKFQKIEIHRSQHYGKILVLDGVVQLTEKDACSYNEMLTHVPLMQHKNPKRVLIIGGGDGYVLKEVLKHASVEHVDHVELDGEVVEVCKEHFSCGEAFDDSRVKLHIQDGKDFVEDAPDNFYDVIIQDSSDPFAYDDETGGKFSLPSDVLYSRRHFAEMNRILSDGGIFNFQGETFNIPSDLEGIQTWRKQALDVGFSTVRYGSIYITSYIGGQIGFLMCEKEKNDDTQTSIESVQSRFEQIEKTTGGTLYYQPLLQSSCFALPLWVHKSIYCDGEKD